MANTLPWVKLWRRSLDDLKIKSLPDSIYRLWTELVLVAEESSGILPALETISFRLRKKPSQILAGISRLVAAGLIDEQDGYYIHDWYTWQVETSKEATRKRKQRERDHEGSEGKPGHVTDKSQDVSHESHAQGEVRRGKGEVIERKEEFPPTPQGGTEPESPKPKRNTKPTVAVILETVPIPTALGSLRFREQWERWVTYRLTRKGPTNWQMLFGDQLRDKLAPMGETRAIAAMKETAAQGWIGLQEPKDVPEPRREVVSWA